MRKALIVLVSYYVLKTLLVVDNKSSQVSSESTALMSHNYPFILGNVKSVLEKIVKNRKTTEEKSPLTLTNLNQKLNVAFLKNA